MIFSRLSAKFFGMVVETAFYLSRHASLLKILMNFKHFSGTRAKNIHNLIEKFSQCSKLNSKCPVERFRGRILWKLNTSFGLVAHRFFARGRFFWPRKIEKRLSICFTEFDRKCVDRLVKTAINVSWNLFLENFGKTKFSQEFERKITRFWTR